MRLKWLHVGYDLDKPVVGHTEGALSQERRVRSYI